MHIEDTNGWGRIKTIKPSGVTLVKDLFCSIFPDYVRGQWRVELIFDDEQDPFGDEPYPTILFDRQLELAIVPRDVTVDLNLFLRSVNDLGGTGFDPVSRLKQALSFVLVEKAELTIDGDVGDPVFFRLNIGGWQASASLPRGKCLSLFAE